MPGIGEEIEGAMQHAAQPARQGSSLLEENIKARSGFFARRIMALRLRRIVGANSSRKVAKNAKRSEESPSPQVGGFV